MAIPLSLVLESLTSIRDTSCKQHLGVLPRCLTECQNSVSLLYYFFFNLSCALLANSCSSFIRFTWSFRQARQTFQIQTAPHTYDRVKSFKGFTLLHTIHGFSVILSIIPLRQDGEKSRPPPCLCVRPLQDSVPQTKRTVGSPDCSCVSDVSRGEPFFLLIFRQFNPISFSNYSQAQN